MLKIYLIMSLMIFSAGCTTIYNPATGRREHIFINTSAEIALGRNIARQVEFNYGLATDPYYVLRVRRIGRRIAEVSDRLDLPYQFNVLRQESINALAVPGGFVYINKGLMDIANDDELAAVIGHEVGHIAARHGIKKLQAVLGHRILMGLIFRGTQTKEAQRIINTAFNLISLGYSREDEFLADRLGVRYAKRAGFNPYGMVTILERLEKLDRKRPYRIEFLSTHPSPTRRKERIKEYIKQLEETAEEETLHKNPIEFN